MNFYTVRDLRTTPKSIWENLSADGEVIITNNGRPTAILFDIADGSFEETGEGSPAGKGHDRL